MTSRVAILALLLSLLPLTESGCSSSTTTHGTGDATGGKKNNGGAAGNAGASSEPGGGDSLTGGVTTGAAGSSGDTTSGGTFGIGGIGANGGSKANAGTMTNGGTSGGGKSAGGASVAAGGGSTASGGTTTVAGRMAGGAATGGTTVAGRSAGGAATGGTTVAGRSAGGAATGGVATGGVATGGTGTGGTLPNGFVLRPCIATYSSNVPEIYARDANKEVYERTATGMAWTKVIGLTKSSMDARSGLSCAMLSQTVYLSVMQAAVTAGAPLLATGTGSLFNDYADAKTNVTAPYSPAVTTMDASGGYTIGVGYTYNVSGAVFSCSTCSPQVLTPSGTVYSDTVSAGPSVAFYGISQLQQVYIAWPDTKGIAVGMMSGGSTPFSFGSTILHATAPTGTTYDAGLSPAICAANPTSSATNPQPVLVAVASGQLYLQQMSGLTLGTWARISTTKVSTSPSCTVRANGTIDVVALVPSGALHHWSGTGTTFTEKDLGGY